MLALSGRDIEEAVTCEDVIDAVEQALGIYESGAFTMPERLTLDAGEANCLLAMPCIAEAHMAVKLLTLYPGNRALDRPVIDGMVMLADRSDGRWLALLEGKTVTALRTAAVTASSIRHIAREDAASIGLVGCGAQGFYQVKFANAVRPAKRVTLFDVAPPAAKRMAERLAAELPEAAIEIAPSTEALVEASEIIITATTAKRPVFPDDPGLFTDRHFVAIGSFQPHVREYPDAIFKRAANVWVDLAFAVEESGELNVPLEQGLLQREQVRTLGSLIASGEAADRGEHGVTFFKSVGMALFDLTTARMVYCKAKQRGLGMRVRE